MEDGKVIISLAEYNRLKQIEKESKEEGLIFYKEKVEELTKKISVINWNNHIREELGNEHEACIINYNKELEKDIKILKGVNKRIMHKYKKADLFLERAQKSIFLRLIIKCYGSDLL